MRLRALRRGGGMAPRARSQRHSAAKRWLRRFALASLASGWLGVLALAVPMIAHGDTSNLASYAATASGWAIQPYVLNDEFLNIPAADQTAPYVFVSMDNTPSSDAKAAYFTPGTAINAVLTTENTGAQVPNGVEARYPGDGSSSSQVGPVSDGVATQASAATEAAQASEGFAQATAGLAAYQFAPPPGVSPPLAGAPVPTVPAVPGAPIPVPTTPPLPGAAPTATPAPPAGSTPAPSPPGATPTTTPCALPPLCLPAGSGDAAPAGHAMAAPLPPRVQLPDLFEQRLLAALRTAELANPALPQLAGGHAAALDSSLPYASADMSGQAATHAENTGVSIAVTVHAAHVQLFQGLITFAGVDSTLQGFAPASDSAGQVTVTTAITGAAIAGIPVTIDQNGVQVNGQGGSQSSAALATLSQALNSALTSAGIQIALVKTTSVTDAGKFQGAGGGLTVTAAFDPGNGVPATHVNFTLGQVAGSAYALPNEPFSSGGGGGDYGGGDYGGGFGFGGFTSTVFGNPTAPSAPGGHKASGLLNLPEALSPGELLALLVIVQGFSTAAVAAAASNAETAAKAGQLLVEEESR